MRCQLFVSIILTNPAFCCHIPINDDDDDDDELVFLHLWLCSLAECGLGPRLWSTQKF